MSEVNIQEDLKKEIIKRFIVENSRVPNSGELNDLIKSINNKIDNLESTGLFQTPYGIKINKEISDTYLNLNVNDINFNIDYLKNTLESLWSIFALKVFETLTISSTTEAYLKNLNIKTSSLLMNSKFNTNLLYVLHEDFSSLDKLLVTSTCEVGSFGAQSKSTKIPLAINSIEYNIVGNNISNVVTYGNTNLLFQQDSESLILQVSNPIADKISISLTANLDDLIEVNSVKFCYTPSNQDTLHLYVFDDNKWSLLESIDNPAAINYFMVNRNLSKFRILITKNSYDYKENSFIYLFKFDSIECFTHSLESSSELYFGPYVIKDSSGTDASFNFVQLNTCEINREKSFIEYYVSGDNSNWIPIIPVKNNSGNSIVFFNINSLDIHNKIDETLTLYQVDKDNIDALELKNNQTLLNIKFPISYKNYLTNSSFKIKRNIPTSLNVFDTSSGWLLDQSIDEILYSTTIENNSDSDIVLNIGNSTAYLNDVLVTNYITISPGIHSFKTNQTNWFEVTSNLSSEKDLIANDPLYPFNHKYLIEGYNYPSDFFGNKVYLGMNSNYGNYLEYVEKDELEESNSLNYYSLYYTENYIYILVNTLKEYSDWVNEEFDIQYFISNNDNSEIYVKAIFYSYDLKNTSLLKNFTIKAG